MNNEKLPKAIRLQNKQSKENKAASSTNEYSKPKAVSVYLSSKDRTFLEELAKENNINRHMLLSYAVRYFLASYRAGHIKLDPTIEAGKVVLDVHLDLGDMDT